MKNLILNTLFVSAIALLFANSSAHADRQGGGGLKVFANAIGTEGTEWVRLKSFEADKVTFDYRWNNGATRGVEQVTLSKADFPPQSAALVKALLDSKSTLNWVPLPEVTSN